MTVYSFRIPGAPVAKGRPRSRVIVAGERSFVSHYTPKKTSSYEERVRDLAALAGVRPIEGPVALLVEAFWEWPRSSWRARAPLGGDWNPQNEDWDNVGKLISDSLNGIAYADDRQVVDGCVIKRRVPQGEQPFVLVTISAL